MRVVIDTNCFLAIIPKLSPYRPVFDAFRRQEFEIAVTTDILQEYEEIFGQKMTPEIVTNLLGLIDKQPNTIYTEVFYRWNLVWRDPDDNKYVDCAIAAGANYIVTNDGHFSDLDKVDFPVIQYISLQTFLDLLSGKKPPLF